MNLIHIVTPTYLRHSKIRELYSYLANQVDDKKNPFRNFVWYVVEDGNKNLANLNFLAEHKDLGYFPPVYYYIGFKGSSNCGNESRKWLLDNAYSKILETLCVQDSNFKFDDTDLLYFLNDDNILNSQSLYYLSKPLWDNKEIDWSLGKVKLFDKQHHYLYMLPRYLDKIPMETDICHLSYMIRLLKAIEIGINSNRYQADFDFIKEYNDKWNKFIFIDYLVGIQR